MHWKKDGSLKLIIAKIFKACAKGCRVCLGLNAYLEWWSIWSNCLPSSELSFAPPDPCHSAVMPSNRVLILSKATVRQGWGHGTQIAFLPDTFCLLCGRWIDPKYFMHGLVWHSTVLNCYVCPAAWHGVGGKLTNVKLSSIPSRHSSASCELTELKGKVWTHILLLVLWKVPLRLAFKQNVFLST